MLINKTKTTPTTVLPVIPTTTATTATTTMETTIALNFILSYLYNKLPRRRVNMFGEELEKLLKLKYQYHWFNDKPYKESGYRCIKLTSDNIDLLFIKAANDSGMELQEIIKNLPQYLTIWIDPGEVSYRLLDKGPVKILYEDDTRAKIRIKKYENLIGIKNLTYRLHHHHNNTGQMSTSTSDDLSDVQFIDDELDTNIDNDECNCYCDPDINYENLLNGSDCGDESIITNAISTNDLQRDLLQQQQQQLSGGNGNTNNGNGGFNPDAEVFKPQLMNSHSSSSLASSKVYKANIFNSTHNIFGSIGLNNSIGHHQTIPTTPTSNGLQQLQNSQLLHHNIANLTSPTSNHHHFNNNNNNNNNNTNNHQNMLNQQQLKNIQRIMNASVDSLSSPFGNLSLSQSLQPLSMMQTNASLWSLPTTSSLTSNQATTPTPIVNNSFFSSTSSGSPPNTSNITTPIGGNNNINTNNNDNSLVNGLIIPSTTPPTPAPSTTPSLLTPINKSNVTQTTTPTTTITTNNSNNLVFTTASFAQTKFGSTKSKTASKRTPKMLPSEFSAYIKKKAEMQQLINQNKYPNNNNTPTNSQQSLTTTTTTTNGHSKLHFNNNINTHNNLTAHLLNNTSKLSGTGTTTTTTTPHIQPSISPNGLSNNNNNNNTFLNHQLDMHSNGLLTQSLLERSYSHSPYQITNHSLPLRSLSLSTQLNELGGSVGNSLFNFDSLDFEGTATPLNTSQQSIGNCLQNTEYNNTNNKTAVATATTTTTTITTTTPSTTPNHLLNTNNNNTTATTLSTTSSISSSSDSSSYLSESISPPSPLSATSLSFSATKQQQQQQKSSRSSPNSLLVAGLANINANLNSNNSETTTTTTTTTTLNNFPLLRSNSSPTGNSLAHSLFNRQQLQHHQHQHQQQRPNSLTLNTQAYKTLFERDDDFINEDDDEYTAAATVANHNFLFQLHQNNNNHQPESPTSKYFHDYSCDLIDQSLTNDTFIDHELYHSLPAYISTSLLSAPTLNTTNSCLATTTANLLLTTTTPTNDNSFNKQQQQQQQQQLFPESSISPSSSSSFSSSTSSSTNNFQTQPTTTTTTTISTNDGNTTQQQQQQQDSFQNQLLLAN